MPRGVMGDQERRFRDGTGARYMKNQVSVRCQARASNKLESLRKDILAEGYTQEDLTEMEEDQDFGWPETQCELPAEEGTFGCKFHGGRSPSVVKRSPLEYMPIDLRQMAEAFSESPDLASGRDDILQLLARNAQLYGHLNDGVGGKDFLLEVQAGLREIEKGDIASGVAKIRRVLDAMDNESGVWNEIRTNFDLMTKIRRTQVEVMKSMKAMATYDQVTALINNFFNALTRAVESYISDPTTASAIIRAVTQEIRKSANTRSTPEDIIDGTAVEQ